MNIGEELAKQAKKLGICSTWHEDLKVTDDKDKLLEMYVAGIDFCLSNDYPSNDFIRANFKGKMECHGIHLDEVFKVKNERKVIALGDCEGNIELDGFAVCEAFVKHNSEISIKASGNSFVMIDVFDNAKIRVQADGEAKVCINHYAGEIQFASDGKSYVKIVEKQRKTY